MTERDDQRLKERFQDLRAEARGAGAVPDFAAMMTEAKRQAAEAPALEVVAGSSGRVGVGKREHRVGRWRRVGAWASVAAAAAVATLIIVDRGPTGDEAFERLVASYSSEVGASLRSPTSSLLDVPGMDLTRSVPSIGGPVRGIDPSSLPAPQPSPQEDNL